MIGDKKIKTNANLKPESGCDELGAIRQLMDHIGYSLGFDVLVINLFVK